MTPSYLQSMEYPFIGETIELYDTGNICYVYNAEFTRSYDSPKYKGIHIFYLENMERIYAKPQTPEAL